MENHIDFVSLHNQTSMSLLDSLIAPKDLLKRAKELGQSAVAIVDHNSGAAFWAAWKASQDIGIKLIVGIECYFVNDASNLDDKFRHIVLIAKNAIGYKNLLSINKKGFDSHSSVGKRVYSVIDWKLIEEHKEGLICLTACGNGIISQLLMNRKIDEAEETLLKLRAMFGDNLGIEILPNNMKRGANHFNDEIDQFYLNKQLINLGKKHNIRVVAACNAHYLIKEEHETHDVLLAIGARQPVFSNFRLKYPVSDFYLKTGLEVKTFFTRNYGEDKAQEFCDNSVYFANLCEEPKWIDPKFSNPSGKELPVFPVRDEPDYDEFKQWSNKQNEEIQKLDEDKQLLRYRCSLAFEKLKQTDSYVANNLQLYEARISEEIDVLEYQGFSSYLLIVADYVEWSRKKGLPTSPGRGSVGGCFLAYLLGIHEADSIKYDLIFARFQNKLRTNFPDVDQDVSTINRNRVLEYVRDKYGSDNVCSISNFNTITPKVYMRDVSRALELGGSREESVKVGNALAGVIPNELSHSTDIQNLIKGAPLLGEYCSRYPSIIKFGDILGKPRAASQHAAGIIISQRSLVGLVPLRKDKDDNYVIEYDKDLSEENGFVKMDILGLSTLDLIQKTLDLIVESGKPRPTEHRNYDLNDEKTYELISKGDTFGVFQFGTSGGTVDLCKKIKPKNIEDLAIITTLARPAAANIRSDFILAREGKKDVQLLHPSLEGAFKKTHGFGLFDESILQLGRDVAGWDLNTADRIRKMIKEKNKNPEKDKKLRQEFIEGAISKGIPPILATRIFDEEIKKFSGYTFNKSHAVVYSMLSYQTAYLKAHYPIEFLLANLMAEVKSNTPDAKINIEKIKKELRKQRVKIVPPDLNESQLTYTRKDSNKLITGLDAIKFVGDDAIKDIIAKRPFKDFNDFMVRVSSKTVRANSIQALAAAGALDSFKIPRKLIFLYCSDYRKKLQVWLKKHDPNQETFVYPWTEEDEWKISELYALEQHYVGEGFACKSPIAYGKFFDEDCSTVNSTVNDIKKAKEKTTLTVKGIIRDFFEFRVKKETSKYYGKPMAKVLIEDKNGDQCSCTIFSDRWEKIPNRLKELNRKAEFGVGLAMKFSGNTNNYEDNMGIILDQLFDIALPPAVPADLKAKKTKSARKTAAEKTSKIQLDEIEDILFDEGLVDDPEDNDDDWA